MSLRVYFIKLRPKRYGTAAEKNQFVSKYYLIYNLLVSVKNYNMKTALWFIIMVKRQTHFIQYKILRYETDIFWYYFYILYTLVDKELHTSVYLKKINIPWAEAQIQRDSLK